VVKLVDLILVVLTPGAGDEIQTFKAGIMEIADIFVLNKADSPGTEKMEKQLRAMLELGFAARELPPVIKTVATKGKGVEILMAEVERLAGEKNQSFKEERRRKLLAWMLRDVLREKIFSLISRNIPDAEIDRLVLKIYRRETDPYTEADRLLSRLKRKQRP